MTSDLQFAFDWLESRASSHEERITYAALTVQVDGRVLTEVEDVLVKTIRPHIHVSLYPLALWFAANWWRLRWEPMSDSAVSSDWRMSHSLAAVGHGWAWPDLSFASDGETVRLDLKASDPGISPVRYLRDWTAHVDAAGFEQAVSDLIETVLRRLEGFGMNRTQIHDIWKQVSAERMDPAQSRWRKLEALLGCDPDESDEARVAHLIELGDEIGQQAVDEVVAELRAGAPDALDRLVVDVRPVASPITVPIVPLELPLHSSERAPDAGPPWLRGELAAQAARAAWGVPRGPVRNSLLSELFDIEPLVLESADLFESPFPAGFRNEGERSMSVALARRHPLSRRFALLRLVADHLNAHGTDRLLPATEAGTARQKVQRAFAQEFLCPLEDLSDFLAGKRIDSEMIETAAAHFQVSPLLVQHKLENKGILTSSGRSL